MASPLEFKYTPHTSQSLSVRIGAPVFVCAEALLRGACSRSTCMAVWGGSPPPGVAWRTRRVSS